MDILSLIGLVLAFCAVIGGSVIKGADLAGMVSGEAFLVVVMGTIAATLVQTPMPVVKHALSIVRWVFKPPKINPEDTVGKLVEWSNVARKQGLLGLEPHVESEADDFVRKGLQMLVDGTEPEVIRNILEVELDAREERDLQGAKMFESMGVYAPTLGIIGAVIGLMAVMRNLAEPDKLGEGIASAFVATIYGIGTANLMFLPMSAKLKNRVARQTRLREMVIEGLISIAEGENPRNIESKLQGFFS